MSRTRHVVKLSLVMLTALSGSALADQDTTGPWNAEAAKIAAASPLASSSLAFIRSQVALIKDPTIRQQTEDAVFNADTCIKSRIDRTAAKKQQIVDKLVATGLIDINEAGRIPGGLLAGVFPGVRDEGTTCPKLPMPYISSPGSVFGGHHSQPGGLVMHVAVNLTSAINLGDT